MIISGLEIVQGTPWDVFELQIVNPEVNPYTSTVVCGNTAFDDPERQKEIKEWSESKHGK
jgi:hypothetical protein